MLSSLQKSLLREKSKEIQKHKEKILWNTSSKWDDCHPTWGFGVAMLPVGALCFYQAHLGRTMLPEWPLWAHLWYSVFYSVSELRRAGFRQACVAQAVLPPGALFHAEACAHSWGFPIIKVLRSPKETLSPEEPSEPKAGAARTSPHLNHYQTEPNEGHPAISKVHSSNSNSKI